MKRSVQIFGIAVVMLFAFTNVEACNNHKKYKQRTHKKHIKKGPPIWAQAHGYKTKSIHRFTYFPAHNIYYDQRRQVFVYFDTGVWSFGTQLPLRMRRVDLRRSYSVDLNLLSDNPVADNAYHMKRYRRYGKKRYYADRYELR
ncbi:hypothetical protein [Ekhidna sp. To15]|uniref:hypothetical protein n=1 Tax=Ekhidna sp. To15 TaxID=3395267 RepID=UPI003F5255C9